MKKIVYVERSFIEWVSIEKVFRQIADEIPPERFETSFEKAPYGNNLVGIIKNLLFFRPSAADIYHITGQIHYMALVLPRDRTVLTVHDLRFLHEKTGLRRFVLKKLLLDLPLKRLKYITAISEATKDEIVKYAGIDPDRIRVIENPLRSEFTFRTSKPFDKERPVILQVGTLVNKNIPRLIEAVTEIPCRLVIVGKIDDALERSLRDHKIDFENPTDLTDPELLAEYERCDIVAFCSTYEGFGLPIIEAQALRKPVVTSHLSPMKEVAGDGAMLVDPEDVESIRKGIQSVIRNDELRNKIVERGADNVKRFRADEVARNYEELYRTIIGAD